MNRLDISQMHEIAKAREGACLSETYINNREKLRWKCNLGHEWEANANNIKSGHWCPVCSGNLPLSIQEMKELAKQKKGKCLSKHYTNGKTKLEWQCEKGHKWFSMPNDVKQGKWCDTCARQASADKRRGTLEEIQRIAEKRGGRCLSEKYINSQTKLKFECAYFHQWEDIPNNVKRGRWCTVCTGFLGEEICRWFLGQLFQSSFPKARPKWLRVKGNRCELDGFAEELGIAFEHHGKYHYAPDGRYSKNYKDVEKRRKIDLEKLRICSAHNVKIIEVPELFQLTPLSNLGHVIQRECKEKGIAIPSQSNFDCVDFDEAYKFPQAKNKLETVRRKSKEKGGKCLSNIYLGSNTPLLFYCGGCKRNITMLPANVLKGHWCKFCAGVTSHSINAMREFAELHKGKCISKKYINCKEKLTWECVNGTRFKISADGLMNRKWWCMCKACSSNPVSVRKRITS